MALPPVPPVRVAEPMLVKFIAVEPVRAKLETPNVIAAALSMTTKLSLVWPPVAVTAEPFTGAASVNVSAARPVPKFRLTAPAVVMPPVAATVRLAPALSVTAPVAVRPLVVVLVVSSIEVTEPTSIAMEFLTLTLPFTLPASVATALVVEVERSNVLAAPDNSRSLLPPRIPLDDVWKTLPPPSALIVTLLVDAVWILTLARVIAPCVVAASLDRISMSPLAAPPKVLLPTWKSIPWPVVAFEPPVPSRVIRPPVLEIVTPNAPWTPKLFTPEPFPMPTSVIAPLVVLTVDPAPAIRMPIWEFVLLSADVPVMSSVPPLAETEAPLLTCAPTLNSLDPLPVPVILMFPLPDELTVEPAPVILTP